MGNMLLLLTVLVMCNLTYLSLNLQQVRPGMINIIPGDDIIAAPQSPDTLLPESQATLPPGDDMEKPSKLKGLFGKKDKKEKEKKEKKEKKDKKDKKKKKDEDVDVERVEAVEPGPDDIEVLEEIALPQAATKTKGPSFGGKLKRPSHIAIIFCRTVNREF